LIGFEYGFLDKEEKAVVGEAGWDENSFFNSESNQILALILNNI